MLKINYDKLYIAFDDFDNAVTQIMELIYVMDDNEFKWHECNLNRYLKNNYSLDISVLLHGGCILTFQNALAFDQFILKFIDMNNLSSSVIINYDKLFIFLDDWYDVSKINKLVDEMEDNGVEWSKNNWSEYLSKHYGIDDDVILLYDNILLFNSPEEMGVFILNFM